MDKPIDLLGNMAKAKDEDRKVAFDPDSDAGKVINFGMRLARDMKRDNIAKVEAEFPDSIAHQCTAMMVAVILAFRSEEAAAGMSPEDSAPNRMWHNMMVLLQPENLGFASREEADALDGIDGE